MLYFYPWNILYDFIEIHQVFKKIHRHWKRSFENKVFEISLWFIMIDVLIFYVWVYSKIYYSRIYTCISLTFCKKWDWAYSMAFGNNHSEDSQWLIYSHMTQRIQQMKIQREYHFKRQIIHLMHEQQCYWLTCALNEFAFRSRLSFKYNKKRFVYISLASSISAMFFKEV